MLKFLAGHAYEGARVAGHAALPAATAAACLAPAAFWSIDRPLAGLVLSLSNRTQQTLVT